MAEVHRDQRGLLQAEGVVERARSAGRLALDTEFVSERRYQTLLCLVQVGAPGDRADDAAETAILDPLDPGFDPAPVAELLADPAVEVLLHAGRQDVALLRRVWGIEITNVFDTQVAAGFAGFGLQISYSDLVRSLLKIKLPPSEGFARWEQRPLKPEQIEYARDDVRHLPAAAHLLQERLAEAGRLDWAREESRRLESSTDERDPDRIYRSLPRVNRLNDRQRAIARAIVDWREAEARASDRPASNVLPDHVLVETARKAPRDRGALADVRGMPERTLHRLHAGVLAAIRAGADGAPPEREESGERRNPADAPLVALATALLRDRASASSVAAELIANQAEIGRIVAAVRRGEDPAPVGVVSGWRRELIGAELLDLLRGQLSLSVGPDQHLRVEPLP